LEIKVGNIIDAQCNHEVYMNTCTLFKVTNVLPCILFNTYFSFTSAPCLYN